MLRVPIYALRDSSRSLSLACRAACYSTTGECLNMRSEGRGSQGAESGFAGPQPVTPTPHEGFAPSCQGELEERGQEPRARRAQRGIACNISERTVA